MSRHHATRPSRLVAAAATLALAVSAILPVSALAQPGTVEARDINTQWQLLEYRDANGKAAKVPPGVGVTILFLNGLVSGEAACSSEYRASYSQTPVSIDIEPPEVQRVTCDAADQAVDDAFYEALDEAASLSLDGDILTVYDVIGDRLLTLTRAEIPLDPTIARWELARIGNPDGSIKSVRGGGPAVEFLRGGGSGDSLSGRIVGSTGCGSFLGSYQTRDSTMRITDLAYRLTDCPEELARQAEGFVEALSEVSDFDVLPAGLSLEDTSGTTRLALTPAIDLGERTWTPTAIVGADGEVVLPVSDQLNTSAVQFVGREAKGRTFCRNFTAVSIRSGLALSVSEPTPDEGDCSTKAPKDKASEQEVEDAFIGALTRTSSHALRGDELELLDSKGVSVLRLVPQAELIGTTWILTKMDTLPNAKGGTIKPKSATPITATFTDIDVVKGETGAGGNDYLAFFQRTGAARIAITVPDVDGTACGGKKARSRACKDEAAYLDLLASATAYIPRADNLRLLQGSAPVLWFEPEGPETAEE